MTAEMMSTDVLFNNYGARKFAMDSGEGAYLCDTNGKRYLDFTAGIAVCSLGHAHAGLSDVIAAQAKKLVHTSNLFLVPGQVELAAKLTRLSGIESAKAMFVNSGTEANEAALKLARRYQSVVAKNGKTTLLSLPGAFHGRTMGALSLTPKPAYQEGFQPLVPDCLTPPTMGAVLDSIDDHVAACIVEVIQGEEGVRLLDHAFLKEVAARLKQVGALLIIDEVQTGASRTGNFFAFEAAGLTPDIITMAKGLGNGFPVGALIARGEIADAFTPGAHGTTFGGNPLAMAVANYVVDTVSEPTFLSHVKQVGDKLGNILKERFTEVSGQGLMWGFDVADSSAFLSAAADAGLLVTKCGANRIRLVPPLIISDSEIEEFTRIVDQLPK